jgi:serine/threonine protein kinase
VNDTPFGRYRLIELLGRGGMGEVWRAFDTLTQRVVALKVLPAQLAHDAVFQQRFQREARAAAALNEPHVVPIHDFGEIGGRLYVTMRLIEGRDLQSILADGPLEPSRALYIVDQIASALNAAHRVGLVHRDVKPSNILVSEENFAYLIDFGIALAAGEASLTTTGSVVGTWAYLAPERVTRGQTDHRSDIYALACVMFECLTGTRPFPGDSLEQQIGGHVALPPPRPSALRPGLPVELDAVVARGMAKDPDHRFGSAKELTNAAWAALNRPMQLPPVPHPPRRRRNRILWAGGVAAAIAAVVAVVLVIAFAGNDERPSSPPPAAAPSTTVSTGPFTGVYRADFGPSTTNGKADDGSTPSTGEWSVRSICRPTGCVATATAKDGPALQSTFVFDDYGGQWHAVSTASVASAPPGVSGFDGCAFPAEFWTVIALQPRPDGTLAGQYRAASKINNCHTERTVTFTRISDVDLASLPDPASQPPRVISPANALHGRYHITATPDDKRPVATSDLIVDTDCLRTGERCVTYQHEVGQAAIFVFADGTWTYHTDGAKQCHDGATAVYAVDWNLALPQPAQDPIGSLSGRESMVLTGTACAGSFNDTLKYDRTGD